MNESVNGTLKSEAAPVKTHLSLFFLSLINIIEQDGILLWHCVPLLSLTCVLDVRDQKPAVCGSQRAKRRRWSERYDAARVS